MRDISIEAFEFIFKYFYVVWSGFVSILGVLKII